MDRKPMRYAHSDGHTDVCYSEDGTRLITCGTDGDIRIWSGFNDDDPVQACVGEWSLCVRQKGAQLHVATDNNSVQLMTFPEAERDGILVRFTAHVNHMAVGKDHDFIAIAAEDMEVKLMKLSESKESSDMISFSGLTGPPLSVALCPKAKLLAVSSGDGTLRVWDVESTSLLKDIECVPKTNSFMNASLLCRIDFEPTSGRSLAYPNNSTVIIVNSSDWSDKLILMCPELESPFSIVQFSPCGNFMAAASQQGDIVIWDVTITKVIGVTKHTRPTAICAMVWNPSGNGEIAFCDVQGQLGVIENCISKPSIEHPIESTDDSNQVDFSEFQFEADGNDDDDEDNENAVSIEKLKNEIMGNNEPDSDLDMESSRPVTPQVIIPEIPLQGVFMPTSTPRHLNPRYLCWNEVGIIRCYGSTEDDEIGSKKSIEVEFHDASLHSSMMMQNFQDYTMGSLSTTALVIANASQISTIPLSAGAKEWILQSSEEDEEIICIASSESLVCFATSNYIIHVCTVYGTQKAVLSVPGPLVSMSAHAHHLLIAYHGSAPRKGDQCLNMMLVKLEGMSIESKDIKSALRSETTLQWLGFTDVGTPAMQDSYGLLSIFPIASNIWLPFCDTTKYRTNPGDGFFITAVFESFESVRGIRCKGSVYPSFIPRPVLSELPIEPPFIEMGTEKSQLEANLFTWSALRVENVEKKFKETALKTFALACKNDLDQRALELIEMMANPQLVTLATKYATKLNRRRLAEKLVELANSMCDGEAGDGDFSENAVSSPALNNVKSNRYILNLPNKRTPKNKMLSDQASTSGAESNSILNKTNSVHLLKEDQNTTASSIDSSFANTTLNTQESSCSENGPKNPFLKSLKKVQASPSNPLSLTDKFAGYNSEEKKVEKENKSGLNNETSEKRKKPESDMEDKQQSNKQRKLDRFMFTRQ